MFTNRQILQFYKRRDSSHERSAIVQIFIVWRRSFADFEYRIFIVTGSIALLDDKPPARDDVSPYYTL